MKKIGVILLLAVFIFSCKKDKSDEVFSFKLYGGTKDFSGYVEVYPYSTYTYVYASPSSTSNEYIELYIPVSKLNWTESDFNTMSASAIKPNIYYHDGDGNIWFYWNSDPKYNFSINMTSVQTSVGGLLDGKFNGYLILRSRTNGASFINIESGVIHHIITSIPPQSTSKK